MRSQCAVALALVLSSLATTSQAVGARRVATGFDHPVFVTAPEGDSRLFVLEQTGRIRIVSDVTSGDVLETPFLDLSDRIFIFDFNDEERGLLGLAFPSDFATSGFFYVHYVATPNYPEPGDVRVARFHVSVTDPNQADRDSETLILSLAKPSAQPNTSEAYHNGGTIAFGPDGRLWMPTGDGAGWFGDDGNNCAQNAGSPLGKLLRIDLTQVPVNGVTVPAGAACPQLPVQNGVEIWARGLRNPYRSSFDRVTGDLYIADVGQDEREEVNVVAASALAGAGPNFGWRAWEGTAQNAAVCPGDALCATPAAVKFPVYDYAHGGSFCDGSITGGYAYRGPDAALQGHYFFSDFCQGFIRSFVWDGANGVTNVVDRSAELTPDAGNIGVVTGFGEGGNGSLYLVDWLDGELFAVPEPDAALMAAAALLTLVARKKFTSQARPLLYIGA